jgi:hypothetical protein
MVTTAAADLSVQLDEAGVSVLLDDRRSALASNSPTPRSWDAHDRGDRPRSEPGVVEVRDRQSGEHVEVAVEEASPSPRGRA